MPTTYAIIQGNKYMDATLYTGTGSTQTITNAGVFKPDLVWMKTRSLSNYNLLVDSNRGIGKWLSSNATLAENTADTNVLTAFNTNGFTVGADPQNSDAGWNPSGQTQVAWQWQAGQGSNVTNTTGTITSTVSANTTAGFSIVTYTGNGTISTVGHGLGAAPGLIIVKGRTNAVDWQVYHSALGINYTTLLNSTAASANIGNYWGASNPTSSVFGLNGSYSGVNANGINYVAYCWAPVAGFSQFGSYTGNGSTDGPFIYTGFRPKFVLIKNASTTGYWMLVDSTRGTYNVVGPELYPNVSDAEDTSDRLDLLSNGFKIRITSAFINGSGNTMVYMAFAETPFKYAGAR